MAKFVLHLQQNLLLPPSPLPLLLRSLTLCTLLLTPSLSPSLLLFCRRKDSSALQRSASIDSFAEIVFSDLPRPSLDIPRSSVAAPSAPSPFSKRPSASSLYSTCSSIAAATAAAASAQVHAQLNVNYGDLAAGSHHHPGNSGSGTGGGGGSASSSRRESMLSPSSTRRNKLTRIINGEYRYLFIPDPRCSGRNVLRVPY